MCWDCLETTKGKNCLLLRKNGERATIDKLQVQYGTAKDEAGRRVKKGTKEGQ
jgi:hypothetical protein